MQCTSNTQVFVIAIGITLMACVQFAQLSTFRLDGVCGPLHQCLCLLGNACLHFPSAACTQLYAAVTSSLGETASSVTFPCTLSNTDAHTGCDDRKKDADFGLSLYATLYVTHVRIGSGESLSPFTLLITKSLYPKSPLQVVL